MLVNTGIVCGWKWNKKHDHSACSMLAHTHKNNMPAHKAICSMRAVYTCAWEGKTTPLETGKYNYLSVTTLSPPKNKMGASSPMPTWLSRAQHYNRGYHHAQFPWPDVSLAGAPWLAHCTGDPLAVQVQFKHGEGPFFIFWSHHYQSMSDQERITQETQVKTGQWELCPVRPAAWQQNICLLISSASPTTTATSGTIFSWMKLQGGLDRLLSEAAFVQRIVSDSEWLIGRNHFTKRTSWLTILLSWTDMQHNASPIEGSKYAHTTSPVTESSAQGPVWYILGSASQSHLMWFYSTGQSSMSFYTTGQSTVILHNRSVICVVLHNRSVICVVLHNRSAICVVFAQRVHEKPSLTVGRRLLEKSLRTTVRMSFMMPLNSLPWKWPP